jgi:PQQ-like domain
VFVTGESQGPLQGNGHPYDYATVAYDAATGKQLWASRYDGHGSMDNDDFARAIAVSHDGGTVYVTGQGSGKTSVWDYTTVAYDAATGKQMWVTSYNGSDNNADAANALAVSPDDRRVFVTGVVRTRKTGTDYGTIAYDARTGAALGKPLRRPGAQQHRQCGAGQPGRPDGVRHRQERRPEHWLRLRHGRLQRIDRRDALGQPPG